MPKRYSIWGTQYGSDHESELAQCDSHPEMVVEGFAKLTVTIKHSALDPAAKRSKIRKYTWLRIVDNGSKEKTESQPGGTGPGQ